MKIIYTKKSEEILVDDEDYYKLSKFKWNINNRGYVRRTHYITIDGLQKSTSILMHRAILCAERDSDVDHIDLNKLNNQKHNLRTCTHKQNMWNLPPRGSTSTFRGVSMVKGKYRVSVRDLSGKNKHIGTFSVEEDAAKAYDKAAYNIRGELAILNFPKQDDVSVFQ